MMEEARYNLRQNRPEMERQPHKPQKIIPKGISKFQLTASCQTVMNEHFIFSDSSISSDSGLEHIKLPDVVSHNIPNVSPDHLEAIMFEMTKDGLYRPTMNDIMEAHEHLEEITQQRSFLTSLIMWIVFATLFVITIAFLLYIFQYLFKIPATLTTTLKLNTNKALFCFISTFLCNHTLNTPQL